MKSWNLALSYIRSSKSSAVSLFFMIFVAVILLNVSLMIAVKMNTFFDEKFEQLQEPHINLLLNLHNDQQVYGDYMREDQRVAAYEREEVIWINSAKFTYGDSDMSNGIAVQQAALDRQFSPIQLIEELAGANPADGIYLPYSFKISAGYQLGDSISLTASDKHFQYTIIGFFETAMMGTPSTGIMKFYLPERLYAELEQQTAASGVLYSIQLESSKQITDFMNDFNKQFPDPGTDASAPLFAQMDSEIVASVGSMTINIITMILIAFALVIIAVTLIVIQFRVSTTIAEDIANIGVLKSLGYTSYQIMLSMLLQFVVIALGAGITGSALSYLVLPVFGTVVTTLSGLLWSGSFVPAINAVSIALVLLLIVGVAVASTLRIFKLPPVTAMRGGIVTHSFKRNAVPLARSKGPLQLLLACKTTLNNMKQNVMIAVIVAAITFASVFSVVLYYNIAQDKTAFIHLVGAETSNIMLQASGEIDGSQLLDELEQMEHVTKAAILDMTSMKLDGQNFYTNISDDYSKLNNQLVYEGRYPKYDNEIAISWVVAELLGKKIGDTVEVEAGGPAYSYLITGLSQSISNLGQVTYITTEGARYVLPHYESALLNIYLDGIDNESFTAELKSQYGNNITNIIDVTETIKSQSSMYISSVFTVMVTVLAITVLIVVLILYLVIKKMIVQRKKELGVLRALGYTTFQLMTQLSLSFVPVVVLAVLLGGVLGVLYTNPLLSVLLSGAGIRNVQFIVNIPLIMGICLALIGLSYMISFIVSYGIKHITTRRLMTE